MSFDFSQSQARSQRLSLYALPAKDPHVKPTKWDPYLILSAVFMLVSIACVAVIAVYTNDAPMQVARVPIFPYSHETDVQMLAYQASTTRFTRVGYTMDDFDIIKGTTYDWQLVYQGPCTHDDVASLASLACSHSVYSVLLQTGGLVDSASCKLLLNEEIRRLNCEVTTGILYSK